MGLFKRVSKLQKLEKIKTESDQRIVDLKGDLKIVEKQIDASFVSRDQTKEIISDIKSRNARNPNALDTSSLKRAEKSAAKIKEAGGLLFGKRRVLQQQLGANKQKNIEINGFLKIERAVVKSEKDSANIKGSKSKTQNITNLARKAGSKARSGAVATARGSKKAGGAAGRGAKATAKTTKSAAKKTGRGIAATDRAAGRAASGAAAGTRTTRKGVGAAGKAFDKAIDFGFGSDSNKGRKKKGRGRPRKVTTKKTTTTFGR